MCNLYSITTNQAAIIALFRVVNRYAAIVPVNLIYLLRLQPGLGGGCYRDQAGCQNGARTLPIRLLGKLDGLHITAAQAVDGVRR